MDNCLISCQVMADMKKVYDDLIIVNLYLFTEFKSKTWNVYFPFYIFGFLKSVFLKYVLQSLYYKTGPLKYIAMYLNDRYA